MNGEGKITDINTASELEKQEQELEKLEAQYLTDTGGKEGVEGEGAAKPGAVEPEVKVDEKTGELVIVEEVELTDEEKAKQLEAGLKAKVPEATDKLAPAFQELQTQFDALAKKYPDLATVLPADLAKDGIKGMFTALADLRARVKDSEERERIASEQVVNERQLATQEKVKEKIEQETVKRLALAGVKEIPKDDAAWDKLWDENPGAARRLEKQIDETRDVVRGEVVAVQQAAAGQVKHNEGVVEKDWADIQEEAKKAGIEVKEEEYVVFAQKHLNNPKCIEVRHGVPYLRSGGFRDLWLIENHDRILQGVSLAASKGARRQTVENLQNNGPRTTVIGATPQGQGKGKREIRIDPNNPNDLEGLTLAQLEKAFEQT